MLPAICIAVVVFGTATGTTANSAQEMCVEFAEFVNVDATNLGTRRINWIGSGWSWLTRSLDAYLRTLRQQARSRRHHRQACSWNLPGLSLSYLPIISLPLSPIPPPFKIHYFSLVVPLHTTNHIPSLLSISTQMYHYFLDFFWIFPGFFLDLSRIFRLVSFHLFDCFRPFFFSHAPAAPHLPVFTHVTREP